MEIDYVFQFDYLNRKEVKKFLNLVNSKFGADSEELPTVGIFVNNIPPDQIVYVLLSFENPAKHINEWASGLVGIKRVFDKTLTLLLTESTTQRKYNNIIGYVDPDKIDGLYLPR